MKERFKTMVPMGRIGKPEAIASEAVFLASNVCRKIQQARDQAGRGPLRPRTRCNGNTVCWR